MADEKPKIDFEASLKNSLIPAMAKEYGVEGDVLFTMMMTLMPAGASWEQFTTFLIVARKYGLNPMTKEIYAFASKGGGVQPIVSVDGWLKLINSNPQFDGMTFVDTFNDKGEITSITCRMHRKDRAHPIEVTEYMSECKPAKDAKMAEIWHRWPNRMLRHKATIQAARYAFSFAGIMDEDEYYRMESVPRGGDLEREALKPAAIKEPPRVGMSTEKVIEITAAEEMKVGDPVVFTVPLDPGDMPEHLKRKVEPKAQAKKAVAQANDDAFPGEVTDAKAQSHDFKMNDWHRRLTGATQMEIEEIFDGEIDPYRQSGMMSNEEYNSLVVYVHNG